MKIEEAIGLLNVHKMRLQERTSREKEQALLTQANKNQRGPSSHGRGHGKGGRAGGREKIGGDKEDEEKRPFEKSKVK